MSQISLTPARKGLVIAGALIVVATWIYLVLVRPTSWESVAGSTEALITLVGYLLGATLLLAGALPALPARTIAIIPVALVLNIVVGEIIGSIGVPLYIDSVGTILVAAIAGPIAGLATGTLSSVVWGLLNPAALPFAAVSAATGFLAGWAINKGAFKKWWSVIFSGAIIGIISGMLAAPVAAFVYGGTAGLGTGAVVSLFRELGNSLIASVTLQSFISDPLDKAIVFLIVWAAIKALPKRHPRKPAPALMIHPATVFSAAASTWFLIVAVNSPLLNAAVLIMWLILGTIASRSIAVVATTTVLALPAAASMVLIHAPYGTDRIFPLLTSDGLLLSGQLSLRFAALMGCIVAAAAMVKVSDVAKWLQASRLGHKAAYVVGASLQSLPEGARAIAAVREANRLSGVKVSIRNVASRVIIPVIARLLTQGAQRGQALTAIGFDRPGRRTVLVPVPDSLAQRIVRWALPIISVLGVLLWI